MTIVFAIFVLLFPILLLWAEKRTRAVKIISPVILCYAVGLLLANLPFIDIPTDIATTLSEVAVPLAIPLLLISTDIKKWLGGAKSAVISFLLCIVAVTISASIAAFFFQDQLPETWKLAGMTMGVYTGGTPNMSAVGLSLDVAEEVFILLNAADLIWGAIYLLALMTIAKPVLGLFLRKYKQSGSQEDVDEMNRYDSLVPKEKAKNLLLFLGITLLLLGAAIGLSILLTGKMAAIIIILSVTTGGIGLSFVQRLKTKPGSYELGDYFLLVFCLSLGSLADVSTLIGSASDTLLFTGFVMFGAIFLHVIMAYFAKIDRDTVIITSVAGIYGPAFVGPIAKVLNNKSIILTGMTTGLIGYAVGNYLGIGLAMILKNWF